MKSRKDGGVSAPIYLGGLFNASDDGDDGDEEVDVKEKCNYDETAGESQQLIFGTGNYYSDSSDTDSLVSPDSIQPPIQLLIRQTAWHKANANQVWPGSFVLADFLTSNSNRGRYLFGNCTCAHCAACPPTQHSPAAALVGIATSHESLFPTTVTALELGAATGALTIFLLKSVEIAQRSTSAVLGAKGCSSDRAAEGPGIPSYASSPISSLRLFTSDIDDEGEVQQSIKFNCQQNGISAEQLPPHVPHCWGDGWAQDVVRAQVLAAGSERLQLRFIFASDILLYVSAYPQLVQTLKEIFEHEQSTILEFVMAWNRRIAASKQFFDLMDAAGFHCAHRGRCIYSFFTSATAAKDAHLQHDLRNIQKQQLR